MKKQTNNKQNGAQSAKPLQKMTRKKRSLERRTLLSVAFCFVRWKLGLPSKWSNTENLPGMGHFADILAIKKKPQEVKQEHLYRTEQGDS